MSAKERIFALLCFLYLGSFFFLRIFPPANPLSMGLLAAFSLFFFGSIREKWVLLQSRPQVIIMVAFGLWIIISALTSTNHHSAGRVLELRLPLLVLPFSLGLITITNQLRDRILLGSAIITTAGCLISLIYAIVQYQHTGLNFWLYNDSVSWLTGQQSIYTSLLVNITIFIFTWFIFHPGKLARYRMLMGFAILFLFIVSYMLASRNMMAFLYLTVVVFCFTYLFRRKKYLEGLALLMAIVMGGIAITKVFPNTTNRFRELTITSFNYSNNSGESHYDDTLTAEQWNGANFRLAAWPLGLKIFREHPLTGVGIGDKRDALMDTYKQKNFRFAIRTNKNVHNNYIDILLGTGLIGFLLFITGWLLLPAVKMIRKKQLLSLLILLTFAIAMITENYFDRSLGTMLFGFFLLLPQLPEQTASDDHH